MKLTLRTLLAYIDNLLPQADAEEFEALLNKNEAANNLCKRIQSVMTRPELGAPEVLDKGPHLDPNVTAEYLDNVLSSEESPEYERLCISSDRQLSEVSACHQILTVVQIEPADVDPSWREKIYAAPERVAEEESVDFDSGVEAPAPAASGFMASLSGILSSASGILGGGQSLKLNLDRKPSPPPVEKPEPAVHADAPAPSEPLSPPVAKEQTPPPAPVDNQSNLANPQAALEQYAQMIAPEINTQEKPRSNVLTWVLSLAAMAALVILFVVLFLGPRNKGASEVANNDNASESQEANSSDSATQKPSDNPAKNEQDSKTSTAAASTEPSTNPEPVNQTEASENAQAEENAQTKPIDDQPEDSTSDLPELETEDAPGPIADAEAQNDDDNKPLENDNEALSPELDDNLIPAENPSDGAPGPIAEKNNPANSNPEDSSLKLYEDDQPQKMVELGQFVKRKGVDPQILAYKAHGGEMWRRMSENAAVRSGDTLLAFPDYRPDIIIIGNDAARLRLVGPARVTISPKSTTEEIQITLEYGRLLLATSSAFTQKIIVKCANLPTSLEINQPSVTVAFESDVLKPEDNPAVTPARFYGTVSLLNGNANMLYNGAASSVASPTFIDCQTGTLNPQGVAAEWIQNKTVPATDLEKRLTGEKPIGVTLSEIIDNKTISNELRETVLVSLSMIGLYSTLVEDFNKEDRFAFWMDEFIVLQNSIFKSQVNAQTALDELKKRYDSNGERIYEILWKYHNDLSNEDMSALVKDLRHEALCVRVAAYCLLKSRGVNLGAYKPNDLKKSETPLKILENKYKSSLE